MRILALATDLPPLPGGGARYAFELVRGLAERGLRLRVVTTVPGAEVPEGVPCRRTPIPGPFRWRGWKLLPLTAAALREVRAWRPDRLLAFTWTHGGTAALAVRRLAGTEYAVGAQGSELRHRGTPGLDGLARRVFAGASGVFANSDFTAGRLRAAWLGDRPVATVHPPVPAPGEGGGPGGGEGRGAAGVDVDARFGLEGRTVLLTAGRLVPRKGHVAAVRAVAALADRHPELAYVITGAGPAEAEIRRAAAESGVADRLRIVGFVELSVLDALYRRAEVYVSPTREDEGALEEGDVEGFGISFVEAAARGTPVVGGRSGGVPEAVADGENGFLVEPGDEAGLREALERLLDRPELREEMGERGREWAARFSREAQAERLHRVLAGTGSGANAARAAGGE